MQFIDLKAQYRALKDEIDANIRGVLDSAQFIGGPYVKELEAQLAAFTDRKHCITCANNTSTRTNRATASTDTRMARGIRAQIIMDASRMASRIRAIFIMEARDISVE